MGEVVELSEYRNSHRWQVDVGRSRTWIPFQAGHSNSGIATGFEPHTSSKKFSVMIPCPLELFLAKCPGGLAVSRASSCYNEIR